jgi:hypothetical protein
MHRSDTLPTHRNKWTGQVLLNKEQICPSCHLNFGGTLAGDKHRPSKGSETPVCVDPESIGLVKTFNKYGTEVWRLDLKPRIRKEQK